MLKIVKPHVVKCKSCATVMELDMELECISSYERQMGPESEYEAIYDDGCPNCDSDIYVRIQAWEYPTGTLEGFNIETEGAEIVQSVDLQAEPD